MSLRALSNQRGVTVYDPINRFAPPPAKPPIRRTAPQRTGDEKFDRQLAALARATAKSDEDEEDDSNPFGRGLGFLINNPVTQTALKPLEYLDYGRRAVTLAAEEFAEGITGQELKATEDDDRSNWEKLKDPTYGVGQLLGDLIDTPWDGFDKWANRGVGLIGDVALDPLTYVGGIGLAGRAGSGAGKLSRAESVARLSDKISDAEKADILRRGWGFASPEARLEAGIRGGVKVGSNANNIQIPGTERLLNPISKTRGAVQDRLRQTSVGRKINQGSEGLEAPYQRMFFGEGPLNLPTSLARVKEVNEGRRVAGEFNGVAGRLADRILDGDDFRWNGKKVRRLSHDENVDLIRRSEAPTGRATPLTTFFRTTHRQANALGLDFPGRGANYVPHLATPDARRWLLDEKHAGEDLWGRIRSRYTEHLDKPSGFTLPRVWNKGDTIPMPDGTEYTLLRGDIDELNTAYRQAGLDFDFYETNPERLMKEYVKGITHDIEISAGQKRTINEGNLAARTTTKLDDAGHPLVTKTDEAGEVTEEQVRSILGGEKVVQEGDFDEVARAAGIPEGERQYFRATLDEDATKSLNRERRGVAKGELNEAKAGYVTSRKALNEAARDLTRPFDDEIRQLDGVINDADKELRRLSRTVGVDEAKKLKVSDELAEAEGAVRDLDVMEGFRTRAGEKAAAKAADTPLSAADQVKIDKLRAQLDAPVDMTPKRPREEYVARARKKVEELQQAAEAQIKKAEMTARETYLGHLSKDPDVLRTYRIRKQVAREAREATPTEVDAMRKGQTKINDGLRFMEADESLIAARSVYDEALAAESQIDDIAEGLMKADIKAPKPIDREAIQARIAKIEAKRLAPEQARAAAEEAMRKRQAAAIRTAEVKVKRIETLRQQITELDAKVPATRSEMEAVMTSRAAAKTMRSETLAVRRRLASLDPRFKVNKIPNQPGTSEAGWVDAYLERLMAVNADVSNKGLNATERLLHDMQKMMADIADNDLSWHNVDDFIRNADVNGYGRVIEIELAEGWGKMAKELVGENAIVRAEMEASWKAVRAAVRDPKWWPFIESLTNLFKTYATLTPGFHLRNGISAAFMNASDGVPLAIQMQSVRKYRQWRRAADPEKWLASQSKEWQQAFDVMWGSGAIGLFDEAGAASRASGSAQFLESAFNNPATRLSKRTGANVEGMVRLAPAYDAIKRGASLDEALSRTTRLHFDYSMSTRLDEQMKRVIPFWTFMSRNLPMQLTQMYTNPKMYAIYNSFVRNVSGEELPGEPEYFKSIGAFRLGDSTLFGNPLYLQPDLAHTRLTEEIDNITKLLTLEDPTRMLSSASPLLTAPIEYTMKKDIFTGREFQDTDMRETGPLEKPLEWIAQLIPGATAETPEGRRVVSENFLNAFRATIPVYDRSIRMAPQLTTGGEATDAMARQAESIARFMGVPIRQLTPEQQQAALRSKNYTERDKVALRRALAQIDAQS